LEVLELQYSNLCENKKNIIKSQSFFWLKKLFLPNSRIIQTYRIIQNELESCVISLHKKRDELYSVRREIHSAKEEKSICDDRIIRLEKEITIIEHELELFKEKTNSELRVDNYFNENRGDKENMHSPWGYSTLNKSREDLFLEAMKLHKIFVQNSRYLRDNLDAFCKMLRGRINTKLLSNAAPALLQSFMLAVPVISTTFASVSSFLRYIPHNEVAYLFIDEAGQAVPQSAVGAIWRAKNVIAVGDPLQIEPVVTLHEEVIDYLARFFGQDNTISSKYTSVQSLADIANSIGGYRTVVDKNDFWIGAPLLVHNRCQKPVFQIANKIAYNEKMIFATDIIPDSICQWLHVTGNSENGHYVQNQADAICNIVFGEFCSFYHKKDALQKYPSVFVISPFRSVKIGMTNYFKKYLPILCKEHGISIADGIVNSWVRECIGTIHTFQGKEANTVILCLGIDSNGKNTGAVDWVCQRPNILNVAVTRSKKNLYIVGDKNIWKNKPFFRTAICICE
jgi:hypothetical protein